MNPQRWQQIQELFVQALERLPGKRQNYVDEAAASDPEGRA